MSELTSLSAVELRRLIGRRALSPVELLDACVKQIEAVDGAVNALPSRDFKRARVAAKQAEAAVMRGDKLGLLHGLPIAIKDLHPTEGLRTTWGSELYADHVPTKDDGMVAAIRAAGAIIIAKSNTPEFGAGANTTNRVFGPTLNPHDTRMTCAGSSGGSAVALACDMVPIASGSDTGGSLRNPAAFCGVVGFRPSPGSVIAEARANGWNPLSVYGPMGRTVGDAMLLMDAIQIHDPGDPLSAGPLAPVCGTPDIDLASLAVAISSDLGFAPVAKSIRSLFNARLAKISRLFGNVEAIDPPLKDADEIFDVLRGIGFVAQHAATYRKTPEKLGPNVRDNVAFGLTFTVERIAAAQTAHTKLFRRFNAFMEAYDLMITPAAAVSPFPVEQLYCAEIDGVTLNNYYHWLAIAYGVTLTGHPAAVIPCGVDENGLPFCIQLVGKRGADGFVMRAAQALETALAGDSETRRPMPDLAKLMAAAKSPPPFKKPY